CRKGARRRNARRRRVHRTAGASIPPVAALSSDRAPAELHLDVARPVRRERADAGAEIPLVVVEELVAPGLADVVLVLAHAAEPLGRGPAVALALRAHLDDLPIRADRHDELLEARVEAAGEDDVGGEREVLEVLARTRHAIAQDRLEPEVRAGLHPAVHLAEVLAVELDRLALARLRRRAEVVDHLDRLQRVVLLL